MGGGGGGVQGVGGTGGYRGGGGGSNNIIFPKLKPNLVCELHDWHVQQHNFILSPTPGVLGRGQKLNFNYKFQIFFNQVWCAFSQMKYIKHIRWDFHSDAWVMPQAWDLGGAGWLGVKF